MLFMSEQLMRKVQKGTHVDFQSGSCEDIYGLGNSILYVMGMPKQLLIQKDPFKRFEHSINFLTFNMAVSQRYSEDLLSIVGCMIQPLQNKRISINRLREKLAPKQKKIINQSIIENKQKQNQFNRIQRKPQQSNGKDATKIGKNVNDFPDKPFKNTNGVPSYRVAQPYVHSQQIMEPVSTSLMIQYIDSLPNKPQSHLERVQSQKHFSTYNFIGKQLKVIDRIDRKQQQKNQNILNQVSFINKPGMKHFGSLSKLK